MKAREIRKFEKSLRRLAGLREEKFDEIAQEQQDIEDQKQESSFARGMRETPLLMFAIFCFFSSVVSGLLGSGLMAVVTSVFGFITATLHFLIRELSFTYLQTRAKETVQANEIQILGNHYVNQLREKAQEIQIQSAVEQIKGLQGLSRGDDSERDLN